MIHVSLKGSSYRRDIPSYDDNRATPNKFEMGRKNSANDMDLVKLFMVFIGTIEQY